MILFSDRRRALLARTIMDLAKIQAAAALTTAFFKEFPISMRVVMAGVFVGLLVMGFLVQPEESTGKE